ncbi:MAG: DoxX family protein [Saprospiraceae bacterium]
MKFIKQLGLPFIPINSNLGLLLLRFCFGSLMIIYHGWEKMMTAERQFHTFPDLIGISSELSYVLVVWFENFGAILLILGLFTRINALGLAFTMFVAFSLFHHMQFTGPSSGQSAFAFGFAYLTLFFTGPGKYSLDYLWGINSTNEK